MSRGATVPVYSSRRSESVVLPWSTCAITEIARVRWVGVDTERVYRSEGQTPAHRLRPNDPDVLAAEPPVLDRVGRTQAENPDLHGLRALDQADHGVIAEPPPSHEAARQADVDAVLRHKNSIHRDAGPIRGKREAADLVRLRRLDRRPENLTIQTGDLEQAGMGAGSGQQTYKVAPLRK